MRKNPKGFTLIEMLIVIVIIGVLATALIPRLTQVQGRARDTARKTGLQQILTALVTYQSDYGQYPASGGSVNVISGAINSYMSSIPSDPQNIAFNGVNNATACAPGTPGQFMYTPIMKNGTPNQGAFLIARTETDGASSNWVKEPDTVDAGPARLGRLDGCAGSGSQFEQIQNLVCDNVAPGATSAITTGGVGCTYNRTTSQDLRYVITQ